MVHRALLGSMERFFGCLVEHYAGAFPLWLAPVQAVVLPITDEQHAFADELKGSLTGAGFRVESDLRHEKLGFKVREAQVQKIPYMLVIGAQEVANKQVSVRKRTGEQLPSMSVDNLIRMLREEEEGHR